MEVPAMEASRDEEARDTVTPAAAAPAAAAPAAADDGAPRPQRVLGIVGLVFLALGFVINYALLQTGSDSPAAPDETADVQNGQPEQPAGASAALANAVLAEIKRADDLLARGRPELALEVCQQAAAGKAEGSAAEGVDFKIALCLESMGRYDKALAAYAHVARQAPRAVADRAILARARTFLRLGEPSEAKHLLCALLLRGRSVAPETAAAARHVLGLALGRQACPDSKTDPMELRVVRPALGASEQEKLLRIPPVPAAPGSKPGVTDAVKENATPLEKRVTASFDQAPVHEALEKLAQLGGVKLQWTPRALEAVSERFTWIDVTDCALADTLLCVLEPLEILFTLDGEKLALVAYGETEPERLLTHRYALAQRILADCVRTYAGSDWTPAALAELAFLETARGNPVAARRRYDKIVQDWPRSPITCCAHFNLAVLHARRDRLNLAENAFYRVVDQRPEDQLTPLALLHIGRMHLNRGAFRQALPPLRRAVLTAAGSELLPTTVLTLAGAYLALRDAHEANALLLQNRQHLSEARYRPTAVFLDAYALYLAALARKETRREPAALLAALLPLQKAKQTPFETYLIGKAFHDLRIWEEVVRTYENLPGPPINLLLRERAFLLAEAYYHLRKAGKAVPFLDALAGTSKDSWTAAARFQLAAMALQENRPRDCLQACYGIVHDKLPANREDLLHLMGEAHERLGEHDKAARCFAGQLPVQ